MSSANTIDAQKMEYLAAELLAGNLAIFVGSGLSTEAGFPSWHSLIAPMAEELGIDIVSPADLLAVPQYYCNELGGARSRINDLIKSTFSKTPPITPTLQALAALPIRSVWTTNYDRLLEVAFKEAGKHCDIKLHGRQIPARDHKASVVLYKLHGDAGSPDEATLTRSDYESFHIRHPKYLDFLQAELSQKTFLFLGFGFRDYNIDYVFGRLRSYFAEHRRQHYCIFRRPQRSDHKTEEEFSKAKLSHRFFLSDLRRLAIDAIEIDNYSELRQFLISLNAISSLRSAENGSDAPMMAEVTPVVQGDAVLSSDGVRKNADIDGIVAIVAPRGGNIYTNTRRTASEDGVPIIYAGQHINKGQTIAILNSYKGYVRVTTPVSGEIINVVISDDSVVSKGQALVLLRQGRGSEAVLALQVADFPGTFYRASDPNEEPYVEVGSTVKCGDVLCIIEAQKTFNRIAAIASGIIRSINIHNGAQVVEGTYLFAIETTQAELGRDYGSLTKLPFRVQLAPAHGRFFANANATMPMKSRGSRINAGEVVGMIKKVADEHVVVAQHSGIFLDYMREDGQHVDVGTAIIKYFKDNDIRYISRRFRVQLAGDGGIFYPSVRVGQFVRQSGVVGMLGGKELVAEHDGVLIEVAASGNVQRNCVLLKFSV